MECILGMFISGLFQSVNRAGFLALLAKDALGAVFSVARVAVDFHIHRANLQALAAVDALSFVAVDAQCGEITHRLQEYRYRTDIFAESAIVF